ncbi:MAG: rhomboid family intramembrane serine protease [Candidatus Aenigmarchaeota archaeon]|nr:rhomboid family intramembrane serine protease [Candidatus Aenigmarchaeota archaeon]
MVHRYYRYIVRKPKWTITFLILTSLIFLLQPILPLEELWFKPVEAFSKPWTFVTSMFLHAGFGHLFFNMFALFIFGIFLEPRISQGNFLLLYFLAGILGNLAYWLTSPLGEMPAVGASGAIYGILGTVAILHPTLIVWFFPGFPMPMIVAAGFWVLISVLGMFTPTNIAHQAHLAGLVVGFYLGFKIRRSGEYW